MVKSSYNKLKINKAGNQLRVFFKYDQIDPSPEIQVETKTKFEKIIEKNQLTPYLDKCFRYFQAVLAQRFNKIFSLTHENKDSILHATLFAILNVDNTEIIENHFEKIDFQIKLFKSLCFFDNNFEEILKITFHQEFKFFDCFIRIIKSNIETLKKSNYYSKDLLNLECEIMHMENLDTNVKTLFQPFKKYLVITENEFDEILEQIVKISKLKIVQVINDGSITIVQENQDLAIIKLEEWIKSDSIIYSLFPGLTGLLYGIITFSIRLSLIAAAETTAIAVGAAASTAWIPIAGWVIFGVTTTISLIWLGYTIYQALKPIELKTEYKAPAGFIIKDAGYTSKVHNGILKIDGYNKNELFVKKGIFEKDFKRVKLNFE